MSVCFGFPVFTLPIKWGVMLVILGGNIITVSLAMPHTTWEPGIRFRCKVEHCGLLTQLF